LTGINPLSSNLEDSDNTRWVEWCWLSESLNLNLHGYQAGILSAKARALASPGSVPFIQTDAADNPGIAVGGLVNTNGDPHRNQTTEQLPHKPAPIRVFPLQYQVI